MTRTKVPQFAIIIIVLGIDVAIPGLASRSTEAHLQEASQPSKAAEALFRFAVYGDTRNDPLHPTGPNEVHRDVVTKVMEYHPALVLQTGDLVFSGKKAGEWKTFDEITAEMRKTVPYYPVRGNHDKESGGHNFEDHVTQPVLSGTKLYYSFEKDDVHFVGLDTVQSLLQKDPQYQWLEGDLKDATARGKFIIPFFHEALFSIGHHGSNEKLQAILHPLFKKYGVRLVFQGHDHDYYHTLRDGITYIVTGGGGAPLYGDSNRRFAIEGDKFEKVHHFCICYVYKDSVTVTAIRQDLTEIESFTIPIPIPKPEVQGISK
jgi:hypothetical protein